MALRYIVLIATGIVCIVGADEAPARFLLVNPADVSDRTELTTENFSKINPDWLTVVLTHGWNAYINTSWYSDMPREFFKKGNYNVILVDWDRIANKFYTIAAPKTKFVGEYLGNFLLTLMAATGLPCAKLHLLGHSLGAHISGFAGQTTKPHCLIPRITAMDAANPEFPTFGWDNEDHRVSKDDTGFLAAVHTDGGVFGLYVAYGHADFYPNCGTSVQPACLTDIRNVQNLGCSHSLAYSYVIESINSNNFIGESCPNELCIWFQLRLCNSNQRAILGPDTPTTTRGIYFYRTAARMPYGLGVAGLSPI